MRVDLSGISSTSKFVDMLSEMEQFAREGKLSQEQIPVDDLAELILTEIYDKKYSERKRNVRLGALESMINELRSKTFDSEELADHFREIYALLL